MAEVIRMPRMSDTMEEGNIIEWLKEEGDQVEPGETLAEVETDKATMELDAFVEGTLLHIEVKEGPVPINGVIAVIGEEGEDWKKAVEEAKQENGEEEKEESTEEAGAEEEKSGEQEAAKEEPQEAAAPLEEEGDGRVKASPLARSMAKEAGLNLSDIEGSGEGGRIVKRDIEKQLEQPEKKEAAPTPAPAEAPVPKQAPEPKKKAEEKKPAEPVTPFVLSGAEASYEEINVSQMRKTIARRLSESKFSAPHFYLTMEIDMGKAIKWRQQINEVAPNKISFNDLVVKAVSVALRHHPDVNSSWLGDTIRRNKDVNIGVAVAINEGLLVPVVRHADMKSLSQINYEIRELAGRAQKRKLSQEEMQGNTFTVSNLGMFGIEEFTAIINPPDACILAVGGIIEKPVVENGEISVGHRMKVTLSCDHRVVDGATGSKFLKTLRDILENPVRLMV